METGHSDAKDGWGRGIAMTTTRPARLMPGRPGLTGRAAREEGRGSRHQNGYFGFKKLFRDTEIEKKFPLVSSGLKRRVWLSYLFMECERCVLVLVSRMEFERPKNIYSFLSHCIARFENFYEHVSKVQNHDTDPRAKRIQNRFIQIKFLIVCFIRFVCPSVRCFSTCRCTHQNLPARLQNLLH